MNSKKFVKELRKTVIEENLILYKDLYENTNIESITENYWKDAIPLYKSLDLTQRKVFFKILRQVEVDTTSNILCILDGVSWLDGQNENFKLLHGNDKESISGELQDLFLEMEEK